MPAWWRLCEDYFRELRVSDLARVVPPHGWLADADPDLLVPPRGRPVDREGGPDEATWWRDAPIAGAGGVGVNPPSVPNTGPGANAQPSIEKVSTTTTTQPPAPSVMTPPAPPFAPYVAPKPSGPAVGHDLLDAELRADEIAALARGVLLFSERREKDVRALAKEFCERDEKHVEDWLAGVGRCKRREERDDMCKGVARWLRHRAATAQIDAAKERRDAAEPLDISAEAQATRPDGGAGDGAQASPYQPPPPTVVAVIKTNDDGTVYVGGEEPAKAAAAAAAAAAGGGVNPGATGGLGGVITGAAAVAARALGLGGRTASTMSASSAGANGGSLSALPSSAAMAASDGGSDAANQRAEPATEEERAEAEHRRLVRRAFGHQGSLPHLHGPCQTDEAMPPHTAMLLDRCFWLASSVSKLPKAPPPTPWISPSPPKLREVVSSRASRQGDKKGGGGGRNGRGNGRGDASGGRCAVCVVQKKGRCGTDTAPRNCLRRAGAGRFKRDDDDADDDEEEPDPFDASPEVKAEQRPPAKGAEEQIDASVAKPVRPKWRTPPAASTAAIAAMRKEERRRRREEAKARRTDDGMASHAESGSEDSSESDESSDESDDDARSAQSELDALIRALDSRPELRAAAPCDEVESETLALQYELLWQSQANRAVLSAVLKRVAARCEEEGETFARVEGDVAEAAQMMSKVREVRRMLKREKREADQRAALERAAAAAAASSRVGAQRRDADGNVIAPAMGALDGLPPDVVAAALGRAEEEATRRAARERERREAAENAALAPKLAKQKRAAESYKPPPPMTGRFAPAPRQPEKAGNAPAASVSARSATPETPVAAAGEAGGTLGTLDTLGNHGTAHSTPPAASAAPALLVDTVHAAAEAGAARRPGECAVCAGTAEAAYARETIRCVRCALPVHPRCYGLPPGAVDAAEGWMCWCCKDAEAKGKANTPAVLAAARTAPPGSIRPSSQEKMAMYRGVSCILCPVQLGAFKQTDDGRWCHVVCAQWQPEVCVKDADEMRCFKGIAQIPKERATQPCVVCGQSAGVTMRCSYGHCQATFHPLCARQSGFHVRASDGSKPQFRAYCDKHSQTQRERDDARGVPPAVVPPPPELGPVTVTSLPATTPPAANAGGQTAGPRGGSPSPGAGGEEGSAIRRLRSDLQRARAAGLGPGGRGGGKRKGGPDGGGGDGGAGRAGGSAGGFDDSGTASDAEPGSSIGPSGVVPTAPKRARTGSAKQLKSAAAAAAAARAGSGSEAPGNGHGREGEFGKSATTTTTTATQPKKRGRPRKAQPEGDGVASKAQGAGGAN